MPKRVAEQRYSIRRARRGLLYLATHHSLLPQAQQRHSRPVHLHTSAVARRLVEHPILGDGLLHGRTTLSTTGLLEQRRVRCRTATPTTTTAAE